MGRPRAANSICELASAFTSVVTTYSSYHYDWVARKGQHSIFALFSELVPKVASESELDFSRPFGDLLLRVMSCLKNLGDTNWSAICVEQVLLVAANLLDRHGHS